MIQSEQNVSPMSNEKRNAYVVAHLTSAFLALFAQKPIGDISISELVEKAGVGRISFYRNFDSKEEILIKYLGEQMQACSDAWFQVKGGLLSEQIRAMIRHFEDNRAFYKLLQDRGLAYLLKDAFIALCGPKPTYNKIEAYSSAFAAYALYGWVDTWLQRGMTETADEIADMFKAQGL